MQKAVASHTRVHKNLKNKYVSEEFDRHDLYAPLHNCQRTDGRNGGGWVMRLKVCELNAGGIVTYPSINGILQLQLVYGKIDPCPARLLRTIVVFCRQH